MLYGYMDVYFSCIRGEKKPCLLDAAHDEKYLVKHHHQHFDIFIF